MYVSARSCSQTASWVEHCRELSPRSPSDFRFGHALFSSGVIWDSSWISALDKGVENVETFRDS